MKAGWYPSPAKLDVPTIHGIGVFHGCSGRWHSYGSEAGPPAHELRNAERMAIPAGTVSDLYRSSVAAYHHHQVAAWVASRGPADNDRGASVRGIEDLSERPVLAPGGRQAKDAHRGGDALIGEETISGSDVAQPVFDLKHVMNTQVESVGVQHFGHCSGRTGGVGPGGVLLRRGILPAIELGETYQAL